MFQSATNYGRDPIVADLTPDSNSILIRGYFQICDLDAAATEVFLNYELVAMSDNTGTIGHSYTETTSVRIPLDPLSPIDKVSYVAECKVLRSA